MTRTQSVVVLETQTAAGERVRVVRWTWESGDMGQFRRHHYDVYVGAHRVHTTPFIASAYAVVDNRCGRRL